MKKKELLIPVGNKESLYMAVNNGADASVQQLTPAGSSSENNGSSSSEPISQSVAGTYTGTFESTPMTIEIDENKNVTVFSFGTSNMMYRLGDNTVMVLADPGSGTITLTKQ